MSKRIVMRWLLGLFLVFCMPFWFLSSAELKGPLSPKEELATFKIAKGFQVELVASEPSIVDPVALAFDEQGRLFVAEMRGYPNGGIGHGKETRGRIKLLVDDDNDGVFEKVTTYAEGLRFPTSVMPWKGGLFVCNPPEILYLEDTDNDGVSDKKEALYTGFGLDNIQQMVNGLQWGLDNWVYAMAGSNGGTITSPQKPDMPPVTLRGRGIRFRPDRLGSLEPTSGGGQFGLAVDDFQHYFTSTNSQHLRQIVLSDHYLRRNPYFAAPAVTVDIPEHGAACKVFRISPFEAWRVERTTRRKEGPEAKRLPSNELVPGGYITSACSPLIYCADLFPEAYRNNNFVCDPANNLIHREVIDFNGPQFVARRVEPDSEFLASTDNWFRPVNQCIGPDGAIYLLDFYREVIETPLSLPDDIKKKLNLESRERGRIWRIVPERFKQPAKVNLHQSSPKELVKALNDVNIWKRLTAQRLLIEHNEAKAISELEKLTQEGSIQGRVHAAWTLQGLNRLKPEIIEPFLKAKDAPLREQGLRLAEPFLSAVPKIRKAVLHLVDDPSAQVRFQLALSLGTIEFADAGAALAKLLRNPNTDLWTRTAILSSAKKLASQMLIELVKDWDSIQNIPSVAKNIPLLCEMIGAQQDPEGLRMIFHFTLEHRINKRRLALSLIDSLGKGMQNSKQSLKELLQKETHDSSDPNRAKNWTGFFLGARNLALDEEASFEDRQIAIRVLAYASFEMMEATYKELLSSQQSSTLQIQAIRSLGSRTENSIGKLLLQRWKEYSPDTRRTVLEALFARPERIEQLLDAIRDNKVLVSQLGSDRLEQLRNHSSATIRNRAKELITLTTQERKKVLDDYHAALDLNANVKEGKAIFAKHCAVCHRLENVGNEVGANLLAALKNKTKEALLIDILDPSREVDPRYVNYLVTTVNGQTITGILAVETPTSITLRRAEKQEDTILRTQIEKIQATSKSLMPEEFEKQLSKQDLADLMEYLLTMGK